METNVSTNPTQTGLEFVERTRHSPVLVHGIMTRRWVMVLLSKGSKGRRTSLISPGKIKNNENRKENENLIILNY